MTDEELIERISTTCRLPANPLWLTSLDACQEVIMTLDHKLEMAKWVAWLQIIVHESDVYPECPGWTWFNAGARHRIEAFCKVVQIEYE